MEGFRKIVSKVQRGSQHYLFDRVGEALGSHLENTRSQDSLWDSRCGSKEEFSGSETTYCSSAMSSRERVSKREWMSALERTVRGMLGSCWSSSRADGVHCLFGTLRVCTLYSMN